MRAAALDMKTAAPGRCAALTLSARTPSNRVKKAESRSGPMQSRYCSSVVLYRGATNTDPMQWAKASAGIWDRAARLKRHQSAKAHAEVIAVQEEGRAVGSFEYAHERYAPRDQEFTCADLDQTPIRD